MISVACGALFFASWYAGAMPVLTVEDMGGPPIRAGDCGCDSGTSPESEGWHYGARQDTCGETSPGNAPVTEPEYQCSFGVRLQPTIDRARRTVHALGLRPYRVYMVWQIRQSDRTWREHHRCELVPVRVLTMDSLEVTSTDWGEGLLGGVALTGISPQQVDEDALRGYLDGEDWAGKSSEREFFFEIQMMRRCSDELEHRRRRFYPGSEPFFDAESFEYSVSLAHQKVERSRDGVDQTIGTKNPDGTPILPGPRLVT